jgi:hypothetical protein
MDEHEGTDLREEKEETAAGQPVPPPPPYFLDYGLDI